MGKILIVDDAVFMRKILSDILIKDGHEVVGEAENAKDAVAAYKKLKPDLVTMDIIMPELDNVSVNTAIKEIISMDPEARILMVSSLGQQQVVIEFIRAGARDFIIKPFEESRVSQAVKRLLET